MAYEKKLIEGCFPCQEVGAETKRERGASSSLPPLYFLHVWWARRPLTPSRAAVLGSILPADTDPEVFLRELGIVKKQAVIGEQRWTLTGKNLDLIDTDGIKECLCYAAAVQKALAKEIARRAKVCDALDKLVQEEPMLKEDAVLLRWRAENEPFDLHSTMQATFPVETVTADPAQINERIAFKDSERVKSILGNSFSIDPEDMYGYGRAYEAPINAVHSNITVLDPTSGGGSIPFEALRLGCNVIANDLNPVATAIERATLSYPVQYGLDLVDELKCYGDKLLEKQNSFLADVYPTEKGEAIADYLYCRVVTCPNCGEEAPLLNAYALDKHADGWMVLPKIEGTAGHKHVRFIPTRLVRGKGPNGEDPEVGSVKLGTGTCIHCGQAITSEEIKRQACGESQYGTWHDELYTIAAVRQQQKLDKDGKPMFYASGANKGKPRMEKVTFFREPTDEDYAALKRAEQKLNDNWAHWEELDLIPTEKIPEGHKTAEPLRVGVERWCDMFTPRQLLGHLTAMETLHDMIPGILAKHGQEKGTAIVTYLQYMLDKCIDYSSKQTRWHYSRGVLVGSFGRHDFSLKWSFGELIYTGPHSGLQWGIDQVIDAYRGICALIPENRRGNINVINGSAANMAIAEKV